MLAFTKNVRDKREIKMTANNEADQDTARRGSNQPSSAEVHALHTGRNPRRPLDWRLRRAEQLVRRKLVPDPEWDDEGTHAAFEMLTDPDSASDHLLEARKMYTVSTPRRRELEARILANRNIEETAQQLTMPLEVVTAYEQLFFNCLDRIDTRYVMDIVIRKPAVFDATDVRTIWLFFGYAFGVEILNDVIDDFYTRGHQDYSYATDPTSEAADTPFGRLLDRIIRVACAPYTASGVRYVASLAAAVGQLDNVHRQNVDKQPNLTDAIGDMLDDAFADLQAEVFEEVHNQAS